MIAVNHLTCDLGSLRTVCRILLCEKPSGTVMPPCMQVIAVSSAGATFALVTDVPALRLGEKRSPAAYCMGYMLRLSGSCIRADAHGLCI